MNASQEQNDQETDRSSSRDKPLQDLLSILDEWAKMARQRESRAIKRYDNIRYNKRELAGQKKHRITTILLDYLQHVTFDSWIALQLTAELLDFAAAASERLADLKPESYAKEVAPAIVALLEKSQKLKTQVEEESQEPDGPDHRLFT